MKAHRIIFHIKEKRFKTLGLNSVQHLRLYRYSKHLKNLGWGSRHKIFFINFSLLIPLIQKGLRFKKMMLQETINLKKLKFIYSLASLLLKWLLINFYVYLPKILIKKWYLYFLNKFKFLINYQVFEKNFAINFLIKKRWQSALI